MLPPIEAVLDRILAELRSEFPDSKLLEARLEYRKGRTASNADDPKSWNEVSVSVRVGNERGSGDTLEEALATLRRELSAKAEIPPRAERIAAILREVSDESFDRHHVLQAAHNILEQERQNKR